MYWPLRNYNTAVQTGSWITASFTSALFVLLEILMIQFFMQKMIVSCPYWTDTGLTGLMNETDPYVKTATGRSR